MEQHYYNVIIVGGGISGTALFYELSKYTDIESMALFEKYSRIAPLNSNGKNNSQTLHCGDIETNYTIEKAEKVKKTAQMLSNYAIKNGYKDKYIFKFPKMVIGVGDEEVEFIKKRYEKFSSLYGYLKLFTKEELSKIEPKLIEGRKEDIVAMGALDEYCAMDFGGIAETFVENAQKTKDKVCDLYLSTEVYDIEKKGNKYMLNTPRGQFFADYVVVDAGAHSLLLAHKMGYGKEYSCLPIGGSFYYAPASILGSKVYTVQNDKLPFAAIHGDPDILAKGKTRFGPTALALPKLERYRDTTYIDFIEAFSPDKNVLKVFYDLLSDEDIRDYIFKNMMFEVPGIRKGLFLKEAKKIVPTLTEDDIEFADHVGGLRPQIIDKKNRKLLLGEAKIDTKEGIVFNMTPSPGATSCLGNALKDVELISTYLNCRFDRGRLEEELMKGA
ncbi:FAD-dependent oxidoreductase [Nitrosophilus alvini]|uniref:FAD-dependent oxidoreductase n=1 Tax=Nitrosophilus alvini TaxID=2714855 RepID=UPI00190B00C8|nr:FAD-dependent oxidoreductase [Nitrosophilus alvini]